MSSFIPNNENNKNVDVDVDVGVENDGSGNNDKGANNGDTDNINKFENWDSDILNLRPNLLRGIYAIGFETPSPIQKEAIIPITKKRDIMAQAQSGTGKTGAFCIGSLQIVDVSLAKPQILMISPTRELALQTYEVLEKLGNFIKYYFFDWSNISKFIFSFLGCFISLYYILLNFMKINKNDLELENYYLVLKKK